jgi:hypothetical protein
MIAGIANFINAFNEIFLHRAVSTSFYRFIGRFSQLLCRHRLTRPPERRLQATLENLALGIEATQ